MANHKSAIKRIRTSLKQNQRNRHYRSLMRSTIKKVLATTEQEAAQAQYVQATSLLDKMASKRIIHANKAANQKSRLAKHVNSLASWVVLAENLTRIFVCNPLWPKHCKLIPLAGPASHYFWPLFDLRPEAIQLSQSFLFRSKSRHFDIRML